MAAGLGFKTFTTGEVLTAADVNGYLMQGVLVFATEAARNSAITSPQEGQFAFTKDTNSLWYYTGSAWAASGATGDIEGVTAGTGISGGGTSGTVTITNSMATAIDAKGDLVVGTGADTFSRLAVGTNGQVLTADSNEATGLKFATPASGGGLTLIETLTLTGSSVTSSTLPTSYKNLYIEAIDYSASTAAMIFMRPNNESGSDYTTFSVRFQTSGSNFGPSGSGTATSIPLLDPNDIGMDSTADGNISVANIYRYNDTNTYKLCNVFNHITNSSAVKGTTNLVGTLRKEAAITSLTIGTGAGTFSSGTVRIYGVN